MKTLSLAFGVCAVILLSAGAAVAQPGRGPGGGPGGGRGGSVLDLLRDENVRKELEIVDDQIKEFEDAQNELREKAREMFSGMRDLSQEERTKAFADMREKFEGLREEMQEKTDKILLPHQKERLEQLAVQRRVQREGAQRALSSGSVAEALDLTDAQKEELEKVAAEAREKAQKKIAEIQKEAQDEVLKVLTPAQRKKWEEMVGEPFTFAPRQFGPGAGGPGAGGPGGGRFGRGGQRPGGQRPGGGDRPDA